LTLIRIALPGGALCCLSLLLARAASAQELEARAYSPNPVGANFVVAALAASQGNVLLNSTAPLSDGEIEAEGLILGAGRTFAIGDRVASFAMTLPYWDGTASADIGDTRRSVDRSGVGDMRLRLTVSLLPGTALSPAEFAKEPPDRTFGASLIVSAPTGEYEPESLINIGTNRWAIRPEIGGQRQFGPWTLEGSLGAWFYGDNDEFLGDKLREQDALLGVQGHVAYTFRPRLWLSASGTWYSGGGTHVDGRPNRNTQHNSRAGLTLAVPVSRRNSLKLAWATGVSANFGGDFDAWSLGWQYLWF
jgi:hypothetical protein